MVLVQWCTKPSQAENCGLSASGTKSESLPAHTPHTTNNVELLRHVLFLLSLVSSHLCKAGAYDDCCRVVKVWLQQVHHVWHAGRQLAQQPDGLQEV